MKLAKHLTYYSIVGVVLAGVGATAVLAAIALASGLIFLLS